MKTHKTTASVFSMLGLLALLSLSCTTTGDGGVVTPPGQGRLTVVMHDDAAAFLREAQVTFASLRAHQVGGDWVEVSGEFPMTVDLLTLVEGRTITLGSDALPPGDYDALEVTITAVHLVTQDGAEVDLQLPPDGVKVVVPVPFTVVEGQETVITLDFRVDRSFAIRGTELEFQPEIELVGIEHRD